MKVNIGNKGFTIIELMIATAIFSFILLIATTGIIRIGQMYYKGVTESKTQDNVRAVSDELSRSIQFAKSTVKLHPDNMPDFSNNTVKRFCLGDYRYTGYLDKPYIQTANNTPSANKTGLWSEKLKSGSECACTINCVDQTAQMLGSNVRLLHMNVNRIGEGDKAWNVNVKIAYGDSDLLTHNDERGDLITTGTPEERFNRRKDSTCRDSRATGSSFCAVAQLDTVVKKRLN